ncbi:IclR family transcriptional regulator [Alicycliphilus denitrificans]|uniref:IclR family transcriptional regulator n=1 Tax=Alicycliphilus denitrificans TaxID=179636 RepID=A0A3R7H471_9BURK|nr:IclR family transcriptional regulator C-terminal domain-containing protein [Alicycliphilus denitrificans]RKJ99075.1 IclR family transcriptional regulator [Alicycliphilus denitrificans]
MPREGAAAQVQSVARALAVLKAFSGGEAFVPLAELARRTGMHKPTVLRLARTLAADGFLVQRSDGAWRLGPSAGAIGARYQAQFDVNIIIEPQLMELSAATGESASFHVYEDNIRSCLLRCEGPRGIRRHVRPGELLPLERGSAGRVILAALGEGGAVYDRIRREGYSITRGERSAGAASVSAAVHGAQRAVLGSVSISGPIERLTQALLLACAPAVVRAAAQLSWKLGGVSVAALRSTWHP